MSTRIELLKMLGKCKNPAEIQRIKQLAIDAYNGKGLNGEWTSMNGWGLKQVLGAADVKLKWILEHVSEKDLILELFKELIKP